MASDLDDVIFSINYPQVTDNQLQYLIKSDLPESRKKLADIVLQVIKHDDTIVMDYLLSNGYKISPLNSWTNETALHCAYSSKAAKILATDSIFFKCEEDINYTDESGISHLHIAAAIGNMEAVKYFGEKGEKLDQRCNLNAYLCKCTPLHIATKYGHTEIVQYLLKHGADVTVVNDSGCTPLHLACQVQEPWNGFPIRVIFDENLENVGLQILKLLVEYGSQLNIKDAWGLVPMNLVFDDTVYNHLQKISSSQFNLFRGKEITNQSRRYQMKKLEYLLESGVNFKCSNFLRNLLMSIKNTRWPTFYANIFMDDSIPAEMTRMLVHESAEDNWCNKDTALEHAVSYLCIDIVRVLLEAGAKADGLELNFNDDECFYYAPILPTLEAIENLLEIIELLKIYGFKLSLRDNLAVLKFFIYHDDYFKHDDEPNAEYNLLNLINYGTPACIQRNLEEMSRLQYYEDSLHLTWIYLFNNDEVDIYTEKVIRTMVTDFELPLMQYNPTQEEKTLLSETELPGNISLQYVLSKHPYTIYSYLQNGEYRRFTRDDEFCKIFPTYADTIKGHFSKALIRHYIIRSAEDYMKVLLPIQLPDLCCKVIVSYLSNEEIWNMCVASIIETR